MVEEIIAVIYENRNEEQAQKMAAYMKNKFKFAGIPKPERKKLFAPVIKRKRTQNCWKKLSSDV